MHRIVRGRDTSAFSRLHLRGARLRRVRVLVSPKKTLLRGNARGLAEEHQRGPRLVRASRKVHQGKIQRLGVAHQARTPVPASSQRYEPTHTFTAFSLEFNPTYFRYRVCRTGKSERGVESQSSRRTADWFSSGGQSTSSQYCSDIIPVCVPLKGFTIVKHCLFEEEKPATRPTREASRRACKSSLILESSAHLSHRSLQ